MHTAHSYSVICLASMGKALPLLAREGLKLLSFELSRQDGGHRKRFSSCRIIIFRIVGRFCEKQLRTVLGATLQSPGTKL